MTLMSYAFESRCTICLSHLHEQAKGLISPRQPAPCPAGRQQESGRFKYSVCASLGVFTRSLLSPLCPLFFCRCVCTSPSLRLPAVPEGQTDQARISDPLLPRGLSCRRRGLPHCDLSHVHRSVRLLTRCQASRTNGRACVVFILVSNNLQLQPVLLQSIQYFSTEYFPSSSAPNWCTYTVFIFCEDITVDRVAV